MKIKKLTQEELEVKLNEIKKLLNVIRNGKIDVKEDDKETLVNHLKSFIEEMEYHTTTYNNIIKLWEKTFNAINSCIWILDKNDRVIQSNNFVIKGLKLTEKNIIGKNCFQILHKTTSLIPEFPLIRAKQSLKRESIEIQENGHWYEVIVDPILNENRQYDGCVHIITDITERKEALNKLQKSEELLKESQAIAHVGSWELDLINDVLVWSDEVYRIFGLQPQEFKATYEAFLEAVYPDDREAVNEAYMGSVRQGLDSYEIGHRIVRKDNGEIRFVHEKCKHIKDDTGKVIRSIGMVQDITERKNYDDNLRESEEKYHTLFNQSFMSIYLHDLEGNILDVNEMACIQSGYSKDELLGLSIFNLLPDESKINMPKAEILKEWKRWLPGQRFVFQGEHKRKDGTIYPVEVSTGIIRYKNTNVLLAIVKDITECKRTEEMLKESEEKFRSLAEESPNMIFINKEGQVIYANKKCEEILGYTRKEFYSENFNFLSLIAPESIDIINTNYALHMKGEDVEPYEYTLLTKDGRKIFSLINSKLIDYGGEKAILGIVTDITERKKAEKALQESEKRFSAIFHTSPVAIALIRMEDNTLFDVNEAWERITGYSKIDAIGHKTQEFNLWVKPDERKMIIESLKNQNTATSEVELRRKNGEICTVLMLATTINIEGENYLLTMAQDITERKQIEEKIKETEETYRNLFQNAQVGLFRTRISDGKILESNEQLARMFGYESREEFIKKYVTSQNYVDAGTREKMLKILKRDGVIKNFEARFYRKDKSIFWARYSAKIYPDKGWIEGVAEDITQLRLIEAKIKYEYEFRKLLMEISSRFINISFDKVNFEIQNALADIGKFVNADRAYIFDYDYNKNICINTFEWCAEGISPQIDNLQNVSLEMIPWWVEKHKKGEILTVPDVFALEESDGVRQILEPQEIKSLISVPMMSEDICIGFIGFDSVKKHRVFSNEEIQLLKVFAQLLVNVKLRQEMVEQLIEAKEKAEEMNKVKSYFFANMSHELRTPFVGIIGFSEILSELITDPEQKELVNRIHNSSKKLIETLNKVLSLTRLEFEKPKLIIKEINIAEILDESFKLFSKTAEKKKLKYIKNIFTEREYIKDELIIKSDETLLRDIINNLISNAIKYTNEGSIELKSEIEKRQDGEYLIIKVADTGIGIPEDKKEIIWKEFRQVSEGRSRAFEGTGLGLTITKKYVELLGGKITVESELEKGSIFTIELPIQRVKQKDTSITIYETENTSEKDLIINAQPTKRILYVEDENMAQDLVSRVLKKYYKIEIVKKANEALEKVKKNKYDALMIDINLGRGIDGAQLMEMIRKIPEYKDTPILAITAFAAEKDEKEFLSRGFTHYISKPFSIDDLIKVVRNMFENR